MNKLVQRLQNGTFRQLQNGRYSPISKAEVRLPKAYKPVCSQEEIAARRIDSMFAAVWSEKIEPTDLAEAERALDALSSERRTDDQKWAQELSLEFATLRD